MQNIERVFNFVGVCSTLHDAFLNGCRIQDLCRFFIDYLTKIKCTLMITESQEMVSTDCFLP